MDICIYVHVCFIFTGQRKPGVIVDAQTSHGLNLVLHKYQPSMTTYRDTYKSEYRSHVGALGAKERRLI